VYDAQAVIVSFERWNTHSCPGPASRAIPRLAATSSWEGPRSNC